MKWQYDAVECRVKENLQKFLNTWGKNGWELIHVMENEGKGYYTLVFKRPITKEEEMAAVDEEIEQELNKNQ